MSVPFVDLKAQLTSIRQEITVAIDRVLTSGHFIGGDCVERFEEEFARFVGAKYTVGVASGTAALELALKCYHISAGDEVIVPANTFFATAEAVSNVGATPVFVDVDPSTLHLEFAEVERVLTPRTRAIIAVHLYGRAMDLASLQDFADRRNLTIIEDAAQAHGTQQGGVRVGGSGRLTCFSFYPGKNLGAYGDAGAVTCNDRAQAEYLRLLRDHGSATKYAHSIVGTNSRLDSIQAAVLSVKLPRLASWNASRVRHAKAYVQELCGSMVQLPPIPPDGEHNFHLFIIRVTDRDGLKKHLENLGIATGIHYPVPLHLTEAYADLRYSRGALPISEATADTILSLPMYPELPDTKRTRVTAAIAEWLDSSSFKAKVPATPSRDLVTR